MASNIVGGFRGFGVIYMLGLGPLLDVLFGRAAKPKPPRASGRPFKALADVHALHSVCNPGDQLYRASIDGSAWTTWAAASTVFSSESLESLLHTNLGTLERARIHGGRANLLSVLYLHFTTEHNFTHHKHVSTVKDPATARYGESVWWFVARTVPGQGCGCSASP